jgi:hypothetical protein
MFGFIRADSHACSEATLTDLTFQHVENDGVEANSTLNGAQSGAQGLYLGSPVSRTAMVRNITLTRSYLHDISESIVSAGGVVGLTVERSWIYTNFSDAAQHSNAIQTDAPALDQTLVGINGLTVGSNVFRNIQGTSFIICLTGQCSNWKIYNNIFYYTADWDLICEHGDVTATCGVSKVTGDNGGVHFGNIVGMKFYGNTLANIHLKKGHAGADQAAIVVTIPGSSGVSVENNLWWNCTYGLAFYDGSHGLPSLTTHDYNTLLNSGRASTAVNLAAHDFQIGTGPGGAAIDPFANSFGNFRPKRNTLPHLQEGIRLSFPYNVDYSGEARGTDGTWERGAFEFSTLSDPMAPNNLAVTGIH